MPARKRSKLLLLLLVSGLLAIACCALYVIHDMKTQSSADVVPKKVSISDSVLFTKDVLLKGVEHLERDLSPLRECSIDEIKYSENLGTDRDAVRNIPGTQAEYTVYYHCDELSDDISWLSPSGSYEFYLKYDPTQSTDQSGWVTVSGFANG